MTALPKICADCVVTLGRHIKRPRRELDIRARVTCCGGRCGGAPARRSGRRTVLGAMLQPVTRLPLRGRRRQRIGSWRHLCRQGRVDPSDPTAEGARKPRRGRGQWCRRFVNRTMSRRRAHGHPVPATTGLAPQGKISGQPPRMKADGRRAGRVAHALNQRPAPSWQGTPGIAVLDQETRSRGSFGPPVSVQTL